jgi:hypothetical protein
MAPRRRKLVASMGVERRPPTLTGGRTELKVKSRKEEQFR